MKNCSMGEELTLEKFMENCLPWEGPHTGAEEGCEEFKEEVPAEYQKYPKEEVAAETKCDELITAPIPHSPVPLEGKMFWK